MTSPEPEKKEEIKCINCELYKKELQEKDAKIKILENNLLKIKSLLSESGSLIDGYNEIMEENKNLKLEIERLKNNINKCSNENYQFDLLKGKMLRFQEENEKLRSSIQFYESQKNQNLNSKNSNEIKIKRELSLKDKEINQLNTVISILKLKHNEEKMSNDEILKNFNKGYNNNILDKEEINFLEPNTEFNNDNEYENNIYKNNINNNNYKINNNIKVIDLYKENEYLGNQYNKYKTKYWIYKKRYKEFKETTKLFLDTMKIIPPGNNILEIAQSLIEKKNNNLLGIKRMKEKEDINSLNNINAIRNININNNQERKNSEDNLRVFNLPSVYNESYNNYENIIKDDKDDNININEDEEKSESKTNNRKSRKKVTKSKKKLIKEEKKVSDEDSDYKEKKKKNNKNNNKIKTESKKRGRKPKNENIKKDTIIKKEEKEKEENKKEEKEEKEEKIKTEKEEKVKKEEKIKENINEKEKEKPKEIEVKKEKNDDNKENINKEKEKKIIVEYIEPIPKNIKKKLDPIAQKALNSNTLLNLLSNNPEKISEENLNPILSLQESLHEKISFLFEVIISNLIQLELSRVLTLFEVFIDITKDETKNLIGINILENINLHLNTNSLLNKKIHLKIMNKSNETYKTYITKNFSSPIFLASFLIDIIYRKLTDISSISNFIYKLVFDKNIDEKNKTKLLIILTNTLKEKVLDINIKKL